MDWSLGLKLSVVGAGCFAGLLLFMLVAMAFGQKLNEMQTAGKVFFGIIILSCMAMVIAGLIIGW